MSKALENIVVNWTHVLIPLVVLVLSLLLMLWIRNRAVDSLDQWLGKEKRQEKRILAQAVRGPSLLWCLIISFSLALLVSIIDDVWKTPLIRGLWTAFLVSITIVLLNIIGSLVLSYGREYKIQRNVLLFARNAARITILVVAGLIVLSIWNMPTTPLFLLIIFIVLAAALASRDLVPDLFAGFQLTASGKVNIGDYIKLETGEEGYVSEIGWYNTRIKAIDQSRIILPNNRLIQNSFINYGHPLKKAIQPFLFNDLVHIREDTGIKAGNIQDFLHLLKILPDEVIYCHTQAVADEPQYLNPGSSNDFANWVNDVLGDKTLGQKLSDINTSNFPDIRSIRDRVVQIVAEHLSTGIKIKDAERGKEFRFVKAMRFASPTPYLVHDLREFIEALRRISLSSLYLHFIDTRLRLDHANNDFSNWLEHSLGEIELGQEVAAIDVHSGALEDIRSKLIQTIEKRIK